MSANNRALPVLVAVLMWEVKAHKLYTPSANRSDSSSVAANFENTCIYIPAACSLPRPQGSAGGEFIGQRLAGEGQEGRAGRKWLEES